MVYTGKGSPTLAKRAEKLDVWKSSNKRAVDHAFFSTIFNRDKPGTSEDEVAKALERLRVDAARAALESGDRSIQRVAQLHGFDNPERMRRSFVR